MVRERARCRDDLAPRQHRREDHSSSGSSVVCCQRGIDLYCSIDGHFAKHSAERRHRGDGVELNGGLMVSRLAPRFVLLCAVVILMKGPVGAAEVLSGNLAGTDTGNDSTELNENFSPPVFGAFVLMTGDATDLTSIPDGNGTGDIFLRNIETGTTQLVSVDLSGTAAGNGQSWAPQMSSDGRYVVFVSEADNLVSNDTNGAVADVFVRDMLLGVTSLVSVGLSGNSGNDESEISDNSISPDGRFVVFGSDATDLTSETDVNDRGDVFVRDLVNNETTLVSVDVSGLSTGDGQAKEGSITPDGRYVLFHSNATNLVPIDTNDETDAFRRDMLTGTTELVSVNVAGTDSGNDYSYSGALSADGNVAFFESRSSDLTSIPDGNATVDVFVRDMAAGITTMISTNSVGTAAANGQSAESSAGMTPDGSRIVFRSEAVDLHPLDT
ncbi:MAG: hypothetical protein V2I67_07185, partial [Thermoanaerobaculales bacterium]|nr:hypothetical protein [Thermoanaerobaculales bacterium]